MLNNSDSRSQQAWLFAQNFLKNPKLIGSVIPSSRYLVERLLGEVNWRRTKVVVEYGPGVGTITRELLQRMPKDASLVAIEMNREFVSYLRSNIQDRRLAVVHGSAVEVREAVHRLGIEQVDCVVSGIPFTAIPEEVREQIIQETHAVLNEQGTFLVYQFTRTVLPHLREVFSSVRTDFEPLNILPAQIFFCSR